ncbi:MAG: sugar transferase [Kiritimatiellia bacterium]
MKITLITVCFNSAKTLPTVFASVLEQQAADYEYLVIDGGSSDGTVELLRTWEAQFNGRMKWTSEPDRGLYDAINKGIARATGDLIALVNADDALEDEGVLHAMTEPFDDPTIDAVYGDIRFVRDTQNVQDLASLRVLPTVREYSATHWKPWMLRWGFMPPHPSVVIRTCHFRTLGAYEPTRYRIAADYELLIRFLWNHHLRTRYLNRCTTVMRMGGRSTRGFSSWYQLNTEIVDANKSNGRYCCFPMMLPKYAFKVFEFLPRFWAPLKRVGDILISAFALLLLSPLLLPICLILRCTGEHHVFYRQERIGLHNRRFGIYKFATMLQASLSLQGGLHTVHGDPRVLPFGKILRKTKINELPQLLNIFLGDMSIVGPRPLVDKTFAPYSAHVQAHIYDVPPGLTGIGSVVFRDEESILTHSGRSAEVCYAQLIAPYKGALELWYLRHQSPLTDAKIIILTAGAILFPRIHLHQHFFRDLPCPSAELDALL